MMKLITKVTRSFRNILNIAKKDGLVRALYCLFYDLINYITPFSIYKVMILSTSNLNHAYLNLPKNYRCVILEAADMEKYVRDKSNDLTEHFLDEAGRHDEQCFAIFDGDVLASYGWCTSMPAHAREELYFYFDCPYKYLHKTFTYPKYRGQRLHAIGMAKACNEYSISGYKGLISVVEAHNLSSLRSFYRLGYQIVGKVYVIMVLGKYYSYVDKGSKKYCCMLKPLT